MKRTVTGDTFFRKHFAAVLTMRHSGGPDDTEMDSSPLKNKGSGMLRRNETM